MGVPSRHRRAARRRHPAGRVVPRVVRPGLGWRRRLPDALGVLPHPRVRAPDGRPRPGASDPTPARCVPAVAAGRGRDPGRHPGGGLDALPRDHAPLDRRAGVGLPRLRAELVPGRRRGGLLRAHRCAEPTAALLVDVGAGAGLRVVGDPALGVPDRGPASRVVSRSRGGGGLRRRLRDLVRLLGRTHRVGAAARLLRHRGATVGVRRGIPAGHRVAPCEVRRDRPHLDRVGGPRRTPRAGCRTRRPGRFSRVPGAVAGAVRCGHRGVGIGRDRAVLARAGAVVAPAPGRGARCLCAVSRALADSGDLSRRERPHRGGLGGRRGDHRAVCRSCSRDC
ncbi:hypothetical protein QE454_000080 [Microbacterium sp. SORGH_AS454]|nr:hypothetical protein [Microbacterium sp. SORGH_AS_0454]